MSAKWSTACAQTGGAGTPSVASGASATAVSPWTHTKGTAPVSLPPVFYFLFTSPNLLRLRPWFAPITRCLHISPWDTQSRKCSVCLQKSMMSLTCWNNIWMNKIGLFRLKCIYFSLELNAWNACIVFYFYCKSSNAVLAKYGLLCFHKLWIKYVLWFSCAQRSCLTWYCSTIPTRNFTKISSIAMDYSNLEESEAQKWPCSTVFHNKVEKIHLYTVLTCRYALWLGQEFAQYVDWFWNHKDWTRYREN